MKFGKRMTALVFSCILALSLLLTSCGGAASGTNNSAPASGAASSSEVSGNDAASKDPVALNIWIASSGNADFDNVYRDLLDAYTAEHPNISYEITFITWAEYFTKLNTGLIGGAGPDVFMLGYGQMGTVQAGGNLLPLNGYIPTDWDGYTDYHENILKVCQNNGTYYGLFMPSSRTFMYRKDIAAANGVTEEDLSVATQEEFFELVRKMTVYKDDGTVETFGLEIDPDGEQNFFTFSAMLNPEVPTLWNDDLTANIDTDESRQAMKNLYGMVEEGCVSLLDPSASGNGLIAGTAAMSLGADTTYAIASASFPDQIGIIDSKMNTLLIGNYIAVNKATKHPDEAVDMLLYLFSKEPSSVFADKATMYSGRKSLDASFATLYPDFDHLVDAYTRSYPYAYAMNPKYTAAVQLLRTSLDGIFHGEDVDKSLKAAQEGWNAKIAE